MLTASESPNDIGVNPPVGGAPLALSTAISLTLSLATTFTLSFFWSFIIIEYSALGSSTTCRLVSKNPSEETKNPLPEDDLFGQFFQEFRIPQYRQKGLE